MNKIFNLLKLFTKVLRYIYNFYVQQFLNSIPFNASSIINQASSVNVILPRDIDPHYSRHWRNYFRKFPTCKTNFISKFDVFGSFFTESEKKFNKASISRSSENCFVDGTMERVFLVFLSLALLLQFYYQRKNARRKFSSALCFLAIFHAMKETFLLFSNFTHSRPLNLS